MTKSDDKDWKTWTVDRNIFVKPSPELNSYKINTVKDLSLLYFNFYIFVFSFFILP